MVCISVLGQCRASLGVAEGRGNWKPLVGRTGPVYCVAVSNDDLFIISGSEGRTVRFREVRRRKIIGEPLKHDIIVISVYTSPGNQQIISMDGFDKVHPWNASTGELLKSANRDSDCARLL